MSNSASACVCLSGGMDSSVLVYYIKRKLGYTRIEAIGFNYGQRHKKELEFSKQIADSIGVPFTIINCDLRQFNSDSALVSDKAVPDASKDEQKSTIVPARNSVFATMATAYAETHNLEDIFIGANADDAKNYPDCRSEFISAMSTALRLGNNIRGIYAPFVNLWKTEIVKIGIELSVPWELTWSCYRGGFIPCKTCDACVERENAMQANGRDYYGRELVYNE